MKLVGVGTCYGVFDFLVFEKKINPEIKRFQVLAGLHAANWQGRKTSGTSKLHHSPESA